VYIEKDASINQDIEPLRLRAASSLMEREDVIIVATVSAIYGLGDPLEYRKLMVTVRRGEQRGRDDILSELVASVQPERRGLRAGHLPRSRRLDRDLPGLRGAGPPDRALGATKSKRISKINPLTGVTIASSTSAPSIPPSTS
jgi:excinuclease ABC subunit B